MLTVDKNKVISVVSPNKINNNLLRKFYYEIIVKALCQLHNLFCF